MSALFHIYYESNKSHAALKLFTGFVNTALIARKLTVTSIISNDASTTKATMVQKIHPVFKLGEPLLQKVYRQRNGDNPSYQNQQHNVIPRTLLTWFKNITSNSSKGDTNEGGNRLCPSSLQLIPAISLN